MENNNRQGCRWTKEEQEKLWDEVEDIFDKHTSPTGGGYEADYTHKGGFISELKEKYLIAPIEPCATSSENKTVGQLLTEAIKLHELNPSVIEKEIGLPNGILGKLMIDGFYTNSVPVVLFKNLILSLHIPISEIESAMLPTFRFILSKETPESIKKKEPCYQLWENEESVIKYTNRLKELLQTPSPTGDRDCEELKKEVERLKGLLEKNIKDDWHDFEPSFIQDMWEIYKTENNL